MNKLLTSIVVAAGVILSGHVFAADTYAIDPVHSSIGFSIKHLTISTVTGNFKTYTGQVTFNEKDLANAKAEASIEVASINTADEKRDGHLKSPDFFDAAKFPKIDFVSKSFTQIDGQYRITGDLTIKGVTKEVSIPVVINGPVKNPFGGEAIGLSGQLTINRQDYGVTFNKALDNGGLMLGNEVTININLEAHKS